MFTCTGRGFILSASPVYGLLLNAHRLEADGRTRPGGSWSATSRYGQFVPFEMITLLDHQQQVSVAQDEHGPSNASPAPPHPRRCCLLRPGVCRQGRDAPSRRSNTPSKQPPFRLLVTGPPRSGLSSLLFQLAYSEAASATASSAVIFIRVQDLEATWDNWLPLESFCEYDLHDEALADAASSAILSLGHGYDPSVLARIQVHHVISIRDVYKILLSMSSTLLTCSPRLIVLDGVDRLFQRNAVTAIRGDESNNKNHDPLMAMSKLRKFPCRISEG